MRSIKGHYKIEQALAEMSKQQAQQIIRKGTQDSIGSIAKSIRLYDDTASSLFTEDWVDLNDWIPYSTSGVQVSNNKLFSTGLGGGNSGANHSYALSASDNLRAVFKVSIPSFGSSGGIIIGVSKDAAGAEPAQNIVNAFGLYLSISAVKIQYVDSGVLTNTIEGVNITTGDYVITVTVDQTYISVMAIKTDGTITASARRLRSGFAVNNLFVFNSDSRALSGAYIHPCSARKGLATITPRTFGEGQYKTIQWTGDGTQSYRIYLPPNYDSRVPSPLAICWHGSGSDETTWSTNANMKTMQTALVSAGYIVLSCSLNNQNDTWGHVDSTNAYYEAYKYVKNNYAIGSVVFYANSMGGIESLNALSDNKIPCVAWAASAPTVSLKSCYDNALTKAVVTSAYGIAVDGSDYATKTAGRDPALMSPYAFRLLPMWMAAASDDTSVLKIENMELLANKVANTALELVTVDVPTGIGGHSFSISTYTSQIINFFNKYI